MARWSGSLTSPGSPTHAPTITQTTSIRICSIIMVDMDMTSVMGVRMSGGLLYGMFSYPVWANRRLSLVPRPPLVCAATKFRPRAHGGAWERGSRYLWSMSVFSIVQDPELQLVIESQFEGRNFPQLSSFIENQVTQNWLFSKFRGEHESHYSNSMYCNSTCTGMAPSEDVPAYSLGMGWMAHP